MECPCQVFLLCPLSKGDLQDFLLLFHGQEPGLTEDWHPISKPEGVLSLFSRLSLHCHHLPHPEARCVCWLEEVPDGMGTTARSQSVLIRLPGKIDHQRFPGISDGTLGVLSCSESHPLIWNQESWHLSSGLHCPSEMDSE